MNTINLTKYTQSRWLKGADLAKRPTRLTVKDVYEHTFEQTNETKPVMEFRETDQALVLNKTQITTMIDLFGNDVRQWLEQAILIQPVPSQFPGKPTILITVAEVQPPPIHGADEGTA